MQSILLVPVIIKKAGPVLYGNYVLLNSLLLFLIGVSSFGVGFNYKRYLPSTNSKEKSSELFFGQFWFNFASTLFVFIVFLVLAPFIYKNFLDSTYKINFIVVAFFSFSYFLYVQSNDYLRYSNRVKTCMVQSVSYVYLMIILVLLALKAFNSFTLNWLFLCHSLSLQIVSWPFIKGILKEIGFRSVDLACIWDDIRHGLPLVFASIMDSLIKISDRYIIAFFMSAYFVGIYSPASMLGSVMLFFPASLGMLLPQVFSKMTDSANYQLRDKLFFLLLNSYIAITIPFVFGLASVGKNLLSLLTNSGIAEKAFLVSIIIALGVLFNGLSIITNNILLVEKRTKIIFYSNVCLLVVSVSLNSVLLNKFHRIELAAISYLLASIISFTVVNCYLIKRKIVKLNYNLRLIFTSLISSSIMYFVISYIKSSFIAIPITVGAGIFVGLFYLLNKSVIKDYENVLIKAGEHI